MSRDDIQMLEGNYDWIKMPFLSSEKKKSRRKMKCRSLSFKNISSLWKKFRLNRLKKKLDTKTNNLVEMEFSNAQLTPGIGRSFTEKRVLRKTKAIARLEAKIKFLETGKYQNEDFIDSRAIKLKNIMMSNLEHNRDSAYGLSETGINQIYGNETDSSKTIDEEGAKIGAKVQQIMANKQTQNQNATQGVPVNPVPIRTNSNTTPQPANVVTNNGQEVSNESVAQAIKEEMDKIKVADNTTSATRVNPFVNEDGTYHLKREDIDEEFRINKFDRSQLPTEIKDLPLEPISEPAVEPFNPVIKRETPEVIGPRREITAIVPRSEPIKFPEIVMPKIKIIKENSQQELEEQISETDLGGRNLPVVVPERTTSEEIEADNIKETVIIDEKADNVSALMDRIAVLRREKEKIDAQVTEASAIAATVDEQYRQTRQKLADFADSLEQDCNDSYETVTAVNKDTAAKQAQIDAMIEIMAAGSSEELDETKGNRRGK